MYIHMLTLSFFWSVDTTGLGDGVGIYVALSFNSVCL